MFLQVASLQLPHSEKKITMFLTQLHYENYNLIYFNLEKLVLIREIRQKS